MWFLSLTYLKRGNRHGWLLLLRSRLVSDLPLVSTNTLDGVIDHRSWGSAASIYFIVRKSSFSPSRYTFSLLFRHCSDTKHASHSAPIPTYLSLAGIVHGRGVPGTGILTKTDLHIFINWSSTSTDITVEYTHHTQNSCCLSPRLPAAAATYTRRQQDGTARSWYTIELGGDKTVSGTYPISWNHAILEHLG